MEIQKRRSYRPEFILGVHDGLKADNRDTSAISVSVTAKLLYANPVLPMKKDGKMQIEANPHYLGGSPATIPETIKRLEL